jgi:hypothetical protein
MGRQIGFEKQRMDSRQHKAPWTLLENRGGSDHVSLVTVLPTKTGLSPESDVLVKMKGLSIPSLHTCVGCVNSIR